MRVCLCVCVSLCLLVCVCVFVFVFVFVSFERGKEEGRGFCIEKERQDDESIALQSRINIEISHIAFRIHSKKW